MKIQRQQHIQIILLFFYIIKQIFSAECPEIKILNPYKSRSWIVEGIQIYNSPIRILRGAGQQGTNEQVSNIMIWDTTTNHCLKIFDLELQVTKMLYSKVKRKLFIAGTHKILEIHPLTFKILDEYNIGGTHIADVEDSDSLILIARDQGNPFLYDIFLKEITTTLPNQYLNLFGEIWATMVNLKDFRLFVNAKLIIFDRNDNYKMINYLGANSTSQVSRVCGFQNQNFLLTSGSNERVQLGLYYRDQSGKIQYQYYDDYTEIYVPQSSPVPIKIQDLWCFQRGNDNFVMYSISRTDSVTTLYKGATVLKINQQVDPVSNQTVYKFSVQEKWKYRRWRKDMEFFMFDEATQRGQSISEYEHYSYEFLESDESQCDFDGDGINDSYCRMTKTISHWPWNLNIGVYFLGSKSEYFLYGQDNQKGYQIRDFNSTEILRFQYPRLIEKDQFSMKRIIQYEKSTYKLPYDTYIMKMCWIYDNFSDMKADHNTTSGFYIYQHYSFQQRITNTYNLASYMNPPTNTEKYKNPYQVNSAFTYAGDLHICVSYTVLEIDINKNYDKINLDQSFAYFSRHNKECYKLNNNIVVNFYQLKLSTQFVYGKGNTIYQKCTPYFEGGQLICRNSKPMLEFWSLDDYTLMKTVDIPGCTGDYDIAVHRKRFFLGCGSSIMIYDTNSLKLTTFQTNTNKIPLFVVTVQDILAIVYSNMEIIVYDLRPVDGSAIQVLNYLDPQDCCLINSIDIHPVTKKLMWASIIQINYIDLAPCLDDPLTCQQCEITAYFDYDPKFSFIKQKYERAPWPIAQPQYYVNPKFLDSGLGTIDKPYLTDMNIMQLYFKTHYYKQNILKFKQVTLNIFVNVKKSQYMGNSLVDWEHDKTKVYFKPWDGTTNPSEMTGSKIKIVILSAKFFELSFDNWGYLDLSNIQIVCPKCKTNTLTFKKSGDIYLRNFLVSLNIDDLVEPAQGQPDTRVFPNIKINVEDVDNFVLENQQVQNSINIDLNQVPFFTFTDCRKVSMTNIVFSNIVNQESLFESENSNIILENIVITKINTCQATTTQRKKFSVIPFQNLIANNIRFMDNQFCDMCLFQNLVSSNQQDTNLIKISNVQVINNKFEKYVNSNILFLKMSLVSQISSSQSIEISNIKFEKNTGSVNKDQTNYYFELIKLSAVLLKTISIIDENLVGIGSFNRLQKLEIQNLNFINSQFLLESKVVSNERKKLSYSQNLILIEEVDKLIFQNLQISGLETQGIIAIQIEENLEIDLKGLNVHDCSFIDSLFTSISNSNKVITQISLSDSVFKDISLTTQQSHIQVGLIWVKAEKSNTLITLNNNTFQNNFLSVNPNTQKKSSISLSIDNSISKLTIQDCSFFNKYASSVLGDLFLNVQSLNMSKTTFQQNLTSLIKTISTQQNDSDYTEDLISQMERTIMKGTFISIQAQTINLSECSFTNAISTEGIIQMYPNNNFLKITLDKCIFSNIYASTTGTAIYVSSLTSPIDMNINNCYFNNLWLGNQQKQDKAHIYLESSITNTNKIIINNLDVYNIGLFISNNHFTSNFIYQVGFDITLQNTIIQLPKKLRNLLMNKIKDDHQNYKKKYSFFNKENIGFQQNRMNKNRLLQENLLTLPLIMKGQTFYGSSLIHSIQGKVKLQNLQIEGSALINNIYTSQTNTAVQPNILNSFQSSVQIDNLKISNLIVNSKGGIFLLLESKQSSFDTIVMQNIEFHQNYIESEAEIYKDIGEAKAFINCIKTDCSYQKVQALCSKVDNSKCLGRILNLQEGQFQIDQSSFENYKLTNQNGTAIFIVNPQGKFQIFNSKFTGLSTEQCGAGLYVYQNNIKQQPILNITENIFEKNNAGNYGGALSLESLFIQDQEKLNILNNQFSENKARISGAIYYSSFNFNSNLLNLNQFQNNKAEMARDIFSEPIGLHIRFENSTSDIEQNNKDNITIKHGSGLQIPKFYVDLFYINSNGQETLVDVKFLSEQKEILSVQMSHDMKNPIQVNSNVEQEYYLTGNLQSQYDSENNQVYFSNIELFGKENKIIYLIITSPYIKDVQVPNKNQINSYEPYRFVIKVNFRPCSSMEIITSHSVPNLSSSIKKCQTCQDLTFAKDSQLCEQCPIGATCKQGMEMVVSQGYWRANYDTYTILPCSSNFEGCIGGLTVGNELCESGYIGPLCQECDLFDKRNQGRYTHYGKKVCKLCAFNFLSALMILGSVYISVYFTIKAIKSNSSFIEAKVKLVNLSQFLKNTLLFIIFPYITFLFNSLSIDFFTQNLDQEQYNSFELTILFIYNKQILVRFLKTIKFKRIRDVEKLQNQSIFIKILMTYFQLIGIIRTVDIKVPDFLPEMSFYFGNPATNAITSLNCIMDEYQGPLHFIYYSFYLSLIIPFIHFLILTITLKVQASQNKQILNLTDLKTAMIFFFTYFQPEFIYQAIQIITCKQIDKISYNQLNISLECDIQITQIIIISTIIIILALIVPIFLYIKLTDLHNDESFKKIENQLKYSQYSFLCINYKHESYYWEFIRMTERMLFILIASIFNSKQILKIILLIFITEGYNALLKKKSPFKDNKFNSLEIAANHVIAISFLIAIGIYSQQLGDSIDILFYIIFIIINQIIIAYILLQVLQEIVYKIIDKLMTLIEGNKIIQSLLESLLICLNSLKFFKLNFNLKVYLSKRKKPLLYVKIREALLQILSINREDRNYLFLSIKEQKNQSKYISNIMSQFQNQYKTNRSNLNLSQCSPQNQIYQKFETVFESQQNIKKKLSDSNILSRMERQKSIFKSTVDKSQVEKSYETKLNIKESHLAEETSDQILNDQDDSIIQNQLRTRNASFYESTFEQGLQKSRENSLYQFPIEQIKKLSDKAVELESKSILAKKMSSLKFSESNFQEKVTENKKSTFTNLVKQLSLINENQ